MRTFITYPIMFSFILSLLGCSGTSEEKAIREYGPFTIETLTRTGKTWNINYGRVPYTSVSYDVKYKGKPLSFANLETNTGVPGIWRVFILKDAPHPTLLLGSQSLYLVSEENNEAVIRPLRVQVSDFASIQWLDSENGQPGVYRELYSGDTYDTESELGGGRFMAISQAMVLDTRTFEMMMFNENNDLIEGYYKGGAGAVAFSPDSSQVVYYGSRQDEQDYEKIHHALLAYNFRNQQHYAVPFDADSFRLKDPHMVPEGWVSDYFEWQAHPDSSYRLAVKQQALPLPRKGQIFFGRHQGYSYVVEPAEEKWLHEFAEYVQKEFNLANEQVIHQKEEYLNQVTVFIPGKPVIIRYGEYGEDISVRQEQLGFYSAENRELIRRLAKGFDEIIRGGME